MISLSLSQLISFFIQFSSPVQLRQGTESSWVGIWQMVSVNPPHSFTRILLLDSLYITDTQCRYRKERSFKNLLKMQGSPTASIETPPVWIKHVGGVQRARTTDYQSRQFGICKGPQPRWKCFNQIEFFKGRWILHHLPALSLCFTQMAHFDLCYKSSAVLGKVPPASNLCSQLALCSRVEHSLQFVWTC